MNARPWTRTVATAGAVEVLMCGCQNAEDGGLEWVNYPTCPVKASLSESQRAALPPFGSSPWDKWATLASHIPGGFAGEYLIPVGLNTKVGVSLVDTTQAAAALDSLAANWSIVSPKPFSFARDSVTVRHARWTFIEINDWFRYLAATAQYTFGGFPRLSMDDNRIEIGFQSVDERSAMQRVLIEQHVPCWLVTTDIEHVSLD